MQTTYSQKNSIVPKTDVSTAASVLDSSSQSESLQRKADMANNATQRAEAPRPNNTGMPDNLKAGIESLSGFSMDNVRVHYNSSKPATVQALAYTQGTDIHVAPGQEKCLPHEAWHVAQQMAGRVSPTTNINGMPVNDNVALEHEADVMGKRAEMCGLHNVVSRNSNLSSSFIQCQKPEMWKGKPVKYDKTVLEEEYDLDIFVENVLNDYCGGVECLYFSSGLDACEYVDAIMESHDYVCDVDGGIKESIERIKQKYKEDFFLHFAHQIIKQEENGCFFYNNGDRDVYLGSADDVKKAFIYNEIAVDNGDDAIFEDIFDIIINPPEEQDELSDYLFSPDLKNSMTELELNWVRNHCDDGVQGDGENVGSFEHVYHVTHAGGHGNSIWWI